MTMKANKRVIALFLCFALLLLPGCSGEQETSGPVTLRAALLSEPSPSFMSSESVLEQLVRTYNIDMDGSCQVEIQSYGTMGDSDAILALTAALSSKENAPDLLLVDGLDWRSYADQGVIVDLNPLLDAEEGVVQREGMFQGPLGALDYKGGLYCLPSAFLATLPYVTDEYFPEPGPVTPERLFEVWQEHRGEQVALVTLGYGRLRAFTDLALSAVADRYVDYETGTAHFDDPSFAQLLAWFEALPEEDFETWSPGTTYRADVLEGLALVDDQPMYRLSSYVEEKTYCPNSRRLIVPGSEDAIGYCQFSVPLAIMTTSPHREQAWEFICYCLSHYMHSGGSSGLGATGTPLLRSRATKLDYDELSYIDKKGGNLEDRWYNYEHSETPDPSTLSLEGINPYTSVYEGSAPCTREMAEEYYALYDQPLCPRFGYGDMSYTPSALERRILSEIEIYFAGNTSLEQCIQALQDSVELMMAEKK